MTDAPSSLRVGMDVSPLRTFSTGTEEYIEGLVHGLLAHGIPVTGWGSPEPLDPLDPHPGQTGRAKKLGPWEKWRWENDGIVRAASQSHVSVAHIPYMSHPMRALPMPTVVTVHDLIPFRFPGYQRRFRDRLYFRSLPARLRHADVLVAVSDATRRELTETFPAWESRVRVILNGVHPAYYEEPDAAFMEETAHQLGLMDRPRILYVGGYQAHKNVPLLLSAFERVSINLDSELVLVGAEANETIQRLVSERGLHARVVLTGRLSREQLAALYHLATVFASPSRYEGFGLPAAQALATGCPTAVSRTPALLEVVQDAALVADPDDERGWAENLLTLLSNEGARQEGIQRGLARAQAFHWDAVAAQYIALYNEVVGP